MPMDEPYSCTGKVSCRVNHSQKGLAMFAAVRFNSTLLSIKQRIYSLIPWISSDTIYITVQCHLEREYNLKSL